MAAKKTTAKKTTAKKTTAKKTTAPSAKRGRAAFPDILAQLRAILAPYASRLVVKLDGPTGYCLVSKKPHGGQELLFGSVRIGKSSVSYLLFPVNMYEEVADAVSPELAKRSRGTACFELKASDDPAIAELAALTERGFAAFEQNGLL